MSISSHLLCVWLTPALKAGYMGKPRDLWSFLTEAAYQRPHRLPQMANRVIYYRGAEIGTLGLTDPNQVFLHQGRKYGQFSQGCA